MINVAGLKVYASEVEQILSQHPAVAEAAVYGVQAPLLGEQVLTSIVRKPGYRPSEADILAFCRERIAPFKVPAGVRFVDALPKGATGKVLKRQLREQYQTSAVAPSPDMALEAFSTEAQDSHIVTIIQSDIARVLGSDDFEYDVDRPLNEIGFDSITAITLRNRMLERGVNLPVTTFLDKTSLIELARLIRNQLRQDDPGSTDAAKRGGRSRPVSPDRERPWSGQRGVVTETNAFALSYAQEKMYALWEADPSNSDFAHVVIPIRIRSRVDISAWQVACHALIDRHAALRTTFHRDGQALYQRINRDQQVELDVVDARDWSFDKVSEQVRLSARRPYDLERGPLFRWRLFTRSDHDHVLSLEHHHIVGDGWSMWLMLNELGVAYQAAVERGDISLPPAQARYSDYVYWQRDFIDSPEGEQSWEYWQQLHSELPTLTLPTDYPRPPVGRHQGTSYCFRLDRDLSQALVALSRDEGVTLYTMLVSVFQLLLHHYSEQHTIMLATLVSNRIHHKFDKVTGLFSDEMVLRSTLSGNLTFKTFLNQTRENVLSALNHQSYPISLLTKRLNQARNQPADTPLFRSTFILQQAQPSVPNEILELYCPQSTHQVKFGDLILTSSGIVPHLGNWDDLTLEMVLGVDSLYGFMNYDTNLFKATTIHHMVAFFQGLLSALVVTPALSCLELCQYAKELSAIRLPQS